jgi:hypothetical protein
LTATAAIELTRKDLHLAAYMKTHGARLERVDRRGGEVVFVFASADTETEWRVRHSNSEALQVDRELLTLKRFL